MNRFTLLLFVIFVFSATFESAHSQVYILKDGSEKTGETLTKKPDSNFIKIKTLKGITSISRCQILKVEPLCEIQRKLKKYRSRVNNNDLRGLASLANWCRQKGLYDKMFEFYDRVVLLDPEHEALRSFVDEMSISIQYKGYNAKELPSKSQSLDLLKNLKKDGLTLQKIGMKIFSAYPEEMRLTILMKGLGSPVMDTRLLSIRMLSRTTPEEALAPLIHNAILNKNKTIRIAAQDTLIKYRHDGVLYPFLRALKSKTKAYRINSLNALARFKDARAAGALISHLKPAPKSSDRRGHIFVGSQKAAVTGFDPQVATSAAIADPKISILQEGVVLDVNVLGAGPTKPPRISKKERQLTAQVLKTVTGQNYGENYLLWSEWWRNNNKKILKR